MKLITFNRAQIFALALCAIASGAAVAAQAPATPAQPTTTGGIPVRITVTAVAREKGQDPANLSKEDFLIYQGRNRRPILQAIRQSGDNNKLDLYILIDDAIQADVTLNYRDIGDFVQELPSTARVGVLYARNGTVTIPVDLTDNRETAIKALRIPLGSAGAGGGIYLSLIDLAKRLPVIPDRRYAILFLSSGIDTFRGILDTQAGLNPDLETAINRLNRTGVTVYPIYVSPAAHFAHSLYLVTNGQSCLARLADETGGEAFFQGFNTPINMKPFLEELGRHLNNQYVVTFAANPPKKSRYESIRVSTEVSGVEVNGPDNVYIPVGK